MQRARATVLLLLWELEVGSEQGGEERTRLITTLADALFDRVAAADASFAKWWLPNTPGARGHLRAWQTLAVIARHMASLPTGLREKAGCVWELLKGRQLSEVRLVGTARVARGAGAEHVASRSM